MVVKTYSATTIGLSASLIEIEIDSSPGLPAVIMVGLPDKAVQESKERIRAAIKQSGYAFPDDKLTINLAPADVVKTGAGYDLPIAVGILTLSGIIQTLPASSVFIGELALDGKIRPVNGILSIALSVKKLGVQNLFIPAANLEEARLARDLNIYPVEHIQQVIEHLNGLNLISASSPTDLTKLLSEPDKNEQDLEVNDFAYIKGQEQAKRALEIAASGGHNVIFIGPPGSGKTLLARSYPTILPKLSEQEILEVTQIYSIAGLLEQGQIILKRPFRSPHHSASHIALVGGGSKIRPGEISLAHRGVLFLDEFPEFDRKTIEALRQPIEDGFVSISRATGTLIFPSRFYLLAAANPTPSGFDPDDIEAIKRPQNRRAIAAYQAKFSGPIMDRIDLQVEVNKIEHDKLQSTNMAENSVSIRQRVQQARNIQQDRFLNSSITCNAEMNLPLIEKFCRLDSSSTKILATAVEKFNLSARSYMRILKLSRTIADLDQSADIQAKHVAESLQFRGRF
ncbi:MAG: YifB family Mg chelatase-like AAA ATPase [Patescibacteria group bacterium]